MESSIELMAIRANPEKFPRLANIPRMKAISQMSVIITQAYLYRGQTTDNANVQFVSSALIEELMADTTYGARYISFAEISRVVKKAVLGTDNFFISVSSLYKVIMDYVKGEGHQAQKELQRLGAERVNKMMKSSPVYTMLLTEAARMITK